MNRGPLLKASLTVLVMLILWWVGILYLDGALVQMMPYDQYKTVALLYPEIYYPALPGWMLAHAQPFSLGVLFVTGGWMIVLSVAIGAVATRYASTRSSSPVPTAAAFVVVLFVAATVIEAAAMLLT